MTSPAAALWTRTILFTLWSALLVVSGFVALFGPVSGQWMRAHGLWIGLIAVCAGQFVFMAAVADRWFPYADRRLIAVAEGGVFLGLLFSVAAFVRGLW